MNGTPSAPGRRSWLLALLLSLLLHAGLALPLLVIGGGGSGVSHALILDPDPEGTDVDVCILLADPPRRANQTRPHQTPAPQPSRIGAAAPSLATTPSPPLSLPAVATRQVGSSEEEEFEGIPSGSRQRGMAGPAGPGDGGLVSGTTNFFKIPTHGQGVVYVIDRSASMGLNHALAAAKAELVRSLGRLPTTARFQVILYNSTAEPLRIHGRSGLVPATEENKQEACRLVERLVAEGGTAHLPALRRALDLQPDVIYFLTDGADLEPRQIREITLRNRGRSVLHAIEWTTSPRERTATPLQTLAADNGGLYRAINPPR